MKIVIIIIVQIFANQLLVLYILILIKSVLKPLRCDVGFFFCCSGLCQSKTSQLLNDFVDLLVWMGFLHGPDLSHRCCALVEFCCCVDVQELVH